MPQLKKGPSEDRQRSTCLWFLGELVRSGDACLMTSFRRHTGDARFVFVPDSSDNQHMPISYAAIFEISYRWLFPGRPSICYTS